MLRQRISDGIKEAMKAGDKVRLGAVRLMQSELKNKDVEVRGAGKTEASEEDILGVLQKMMKQRQESLAIYEKAGRADLAATEKAEMEAISSFLPKQMSDAEVADAIKAAIAETGAASMKDMGKVVGALRAKYAGQMDFGKASGLVKAALSG
ncbi:GatB/YqeY domain-containing protein [Terrarubrum flagellatum]|uniref:GatB/YqeY domain-containing protein n=1 Tax=Terrirubrum flagellatum TaxID=2895980 RepID=UPI0031450527